jgi:type IX secretion system PorP/SprF family membrane protein
LTAFHSNQINGTFAYRIPVGKTKKIKVSLGLSAGATNTRIDPSKLTSGQANDKSFVNATSVWMPDLGVGAYVYGPKFFVGLSVNNLLSPSLTKSGDLAQKTDVNRQYIHTYATAGYVFDLGKKVKFAPSVIMKYVPVHAPITFDFNANFIFIDRLWLGVSYRLAESYGFMAAVNATPQFRIGYAYDLVVNPLKVGTSGSHEIMLGYDFDFRRSRIVNPRYVRYF